MGTYIEPYPMRIPRALGDALFRPSMQWNWPRDWKLTQTCGSLHWFLSLCADVYKNPLQVRTRPVWIDKIFNKNIKIVFQIAVFHLCQQALVSLLCNGREGPNATATIKGKGIPSNARCITSVSDITLNFEFYCILCASKDHWLTKF